MTIYDKNKQRADELQQQYGLMETLHDLFAWEELTEEEAIGIQKYFDATHPKYTGEYESDLKLLEAFEKEVATWDISEDQLTDPKAKSLYESCCLELDEALALQKIRLLNE